MRYLIVAFSLLCLISNAFADVNLAKKMTLSVSPWQLTADGYWYATARIQYFDQTGNEIDIPNASSGFDVTGASSRTLARWEEQDRMAIITLDHGKSSSVPIVKAWSRSPKFKPIIKKLTVPADDLSHLSINALNIGPYANGLGWTPLSKFSPVIGYRLYRIHGQEKKLLATLPATQNSYFDANGIMPGQQYQYQLDVLIGKQVKTIRSDVLIAMQAVPAVPMKNFYGKGVLLFFRPDAKGEKSYTTYPISSVIHKANLAKLNYLEIQLQYGSACKLNNPGVNAWYSELLSKAHQNHIKVLAWVVPRSPTFETEQKIISLLADARAGDHLDGLVLNIEPGESYMGDQRFPEKVIKLLSELRAAVGEKYPLVVMMPLPKAAGTFPYVGMAKYINAVEPMVFWHHKIKKGFNYDHKFVSNYCQTALTQLNKTYQNTMPIIMVGQSADLGGTGIPSAREIIWATQAAKQMNAKVVALFDWSGMKDACWAELGGITM